MIKQDTPVPEIKIYKPLVPPEEFLAKEFQKNDQGKARMSLIPHEALMGVAKVMTFGEKKYSAYNWKKGTEWSRYYDAAMRHMVAWSMGENLDPETGLNHLHHAASCVMMLSSLVEMDVGTDDRFKP